MHSNLQKFFLFQLISDLRSSYAARSFWGDELEIPKCFPVYPKNSCLEPKKWEVIIVWIVSIICCIGILVAMTVPSWKAGHFYWVSIFFITFPLTVVSGPLWMLIRNWNYFSCLKSVEIREQFALTPIPPEILLRCYIEKSIYWSILPFAIVVGGQILMILVPVSFFILVDSFLGFMMVIPVIFIFSIGYIMWISLFYIYLFSDLLRSFQKSCASRDNQTLGFGFVLSFLRSFVAASAVTFLLGFLIIIALAFIGNLIGEIIGFRVGELVTFFAAIGLTVAALIIARIVLEIINSELINTRKTWHETAKQYYIFE